jgi:transposase-like protein
MPRPTRRHRDADESRALLADARARGLSQAALAEELGVHPNTVHNWARREREGSSCALARTPHARPTRDSVSLIPVRVLDVAASARGGNRAVDPALGAELVLERVLGGRDVLLRLPRGIEAEDLRTLLNVITESARC